MINQSFINFLFLFFIIHHLFIESRFFSLFFLFIFFYILSRSYYLHNVVSKNDRTIMIEYELFRDYYLRYILLNLNEMNYLDNMKPKEKSFNK